MSSDCNGENDKMDGFTDDIVILPKGIKFRVIGIDSDI